MQAASTHKHNLAPFPAAALPYRFLPLVGCRLAAMTELEREVELADRAEKRQRELERQRLLEQVTSCTGHDGK
jgi:hypothetical protein